MSTFFRVPPAPNPFKFWGKAILLWSLGIGACYYLAGCSSPGKVGFAQLKQQNAAQTRVLKAATVQADSISRHADRGLELTTRLAQTHLDAAQAKELDEIRVEFNAVKLENTGLVQKLLNAEGLALQQTATITQTQAEVIAVTHRRFWENVWLRCWWFGVGALTLFVALVILRLVRGGAKLATAVAMV